MQLLATAIVDAEEGGDSHTGLYKRPAELCLFVLEFHRVARRVGVRLVIEYRMIGMIGIPKEYRRYMHQYTYSMHIC